MPEFGLGLVTVLLADGSAFETTAYGPDGARLWFCRATNRQRACLTHWEVAERLRAGQGLPPQPTGGLNGPGVPGSGRFWGDGR
jgi:hypothetical protein